MEASSSVPNELAQLLQSIIRTLPPHELELVLSHLPMPELARLSCVHKAFLVAWRSLREQHPGRRYAPPSRGELNRAKAFRRLERAAFLGDVAVIRSAVAAGRRLQARDGLGSRKVDKILWHAADGGRVQSLELLLTLGASVRSRHDHALLRASGNGHTDAVQFLIQRGANVHADHDVALRQASRIAKAEVVRLLIQHGANVRADDDCALRSASRNGHAAVVQLLIEHGADLHAHDDEALLWASERGFVAVVQLLLQHGANVHGEALARASRNGHAAVVQLLIQHGARSVS